MNGDLPDGRGPFLKPARPVFRRRQIHPRPYRDHTFPMAGSSGKRRSVFPFIPGILSYIQYRRHHGTENSAYCNTYFYSNMADLGGSVAHHARASSTTPVSAPVGTRATTPLMALVLYPTSEERQRVRTIAQGTP